MEQHKKYSDAAGLRIVAVGLGQPKHARRYCGKLAPGASCFVDDSAKAYHAFGLQQGAARQLLSRQVLVAGIRAKKRGHSQGKTTGDAKMLGGTFIIDQQGIIKLTYYSQYAGDNPDLTKFIDLAKESLSTEHLTAE